MSEGPVTVRLPKDDKERLTAEAEKHGMSLAEILRTGANLIAGFDTDFWKQLTSFSNQFNLPESKVIQNLVTSWMARKAAEEEVFPKTDELLVEFVFSNLGPLPSKTLFENIKSDYIQRLENQKEVNIRIRSEKGIAKADELTWLKNREQRRAGLEQELKDAEHAQKAGTKGLLSGEELQKTINALKKKSTDQ